MNLKNKNSMLRKLRSAAAAFFFICITLLFLDFTGTLHAWLGWMAKIQFLPAFLALNVGVVSALIILTLIFGRVYCSVICPMGVFQDIISWIHGKTKKKNKFRFSYSPAKNWLRYGMLVLFIAALVAGIGSFAALLAPYSSYGRIASNLFAPVYQWGNNLLAFFAGRAESYAFYSKEVWLKSLPTFLIATATFVVIFVLAWKNGRTYCNTICPVGTILGFFSRYSLFAPVIDTEKCRNCGLCGKQCKASCINMKEHKIDYSRCVVCMDCIDTCKEGAIKYKSRHSLKKAGDKKAESATVGTEGNGRNEANGRRTFIATAVAVSATAAAKAQTMKVDGGLAEIQDKKVPVRKTRLKPAGSLSVRHFDQHCTACQLCVSVCPNNVLRPSASLMTLMQPEMSYEKGWCRPECNRCSQVCPAGAIKPVSIEEKSSVQVGHAVVIRENCVVNTDGVSCSNCARHCPAHAIMMVPSDPENPKSLKIPAVNEEKCIGCGACENLCPARPFSAIYVEGHSVHKHN